MKNEIRLALLCLATAAAPAFAQNASPSCGPANFDQSRNAYTVMGRVAGAANQQCLITVYPSGAMPGEAARNPLSYLPEGSYIIELSGGGGGGGSGSGEMTNEERRASKSRDDERGGGGGGASAAPFRTVQYLAPGTYRLTIGTGGEGGSARNMQSSDGGSTSLTNANTGQLIAGFPGADRMTQRSNAASNGGGGSAAAGGVSGGSGGEHRGGQGGASADSSGFGAGGNGGKGDERTVRAGDSGGSGFIRLTMSQPAPQAMVPAPVAMATESVAMQPERTGARAEAVTAPAPQLRPARKDRN